MNPDIVLNFFKDHDKLVLPILLFIMIFKKQIIAIVTIILKKTKNKSIQELGEELEDLSIHGELTDKDLNEPYDEPGICKFNEVCLITDDDAFVENLIKRIDRCRNLVSQLTLNFTNVTKVNSKFVIGLQKIFLDILYNNNVNVYLIFDNNPIIEMDELYNEWKSKIDKKGAKSITLKKDRRAHGG